MKKPSLLLSLSCNKKGQASTELAVAGVIAIMALAYLVQYAYIYNSRQALEMYAFRTALKLSQEKERGVSFTVIRDVILPSFFTGVSKQRLMASATVEHNPYKIYIPYEDDPRDLPNIQLIQINDGMIRTGTFLQVPPTLVHIKYKDQDDEGAMWTSSSIAEFDSQASPDNKTSAYNSSAIISQDSLGGYLIKKRLNSTDSDSADIIFDNATNMKNNYVADDWERHISSVVISQKDIPANVSLVLKEEVAKSKNVYMPP